MSATTTPETEASTLEEKVRELCQFVLDSPEYVAAQGQIDAFEESKDAQKVYQAWQQKAAELHQMHHEGRKPTDSDIVEAERLREAVMDNSVASDFTEAEDTLNSMFGTIVKTVQKTLQNGSVPTADEMDECCGSGGCGCH